jgi:hypothetical protein
LSEEVPAVTNKERSFNLGNSVLPISLVMVLCGQTFALGVMSTKVDTLVTAVAGAPSSDYVKSLEERIEKLERQRETTDMTIITLREKLAENGWRPIPKGVH